MSMEPASASRTGEPLELKESVETARTMAYDGGAFSASTPGVGMSNSGRSPAVAPGMAEGTLPPSQASTRSLTSSAGSVAVLPQLKLAEGEIELVTEPKDRYTHVRPLGEGGVGEVDLVQDVDIGRQVARKRLRAESRTPASVARFIDEIRTVGRLEHPGIVPIHDVGMDENGYFFTMRKAEGETLESILDGLRSNAPEYQKRYSIDVRVGIFMQILRTLEFAHKQGFLHRDIKPANIMVGPLGEVYVMDWGLAKPLPKELSSAPSIKTAAALPEEGFDKAQTLDEAEMAPAPSPTEERERLFLTRVGAIVGSPAYMSPEQAMGRNDKLDARSDTYSLSVLFFEMLSLRHYLAKHLTVRAMLHAIVVEQPVSAIGMHHRYGIPPEYTFYIRRGLEKNRNERFQSVAEMISGLQRILNGNVPVQCPCTAIKRSGGIFGDFVDRHPIGGIAVAVMGVGLALLGGWDVIRTLVHLLHPHG